jgi:hypothetical protein
MIFNKKDWQGKRKDQVDFTNNVVTYGVYILLLVLTTMILFS